MKQKLFTFFLASFVLFSLNGLSQNLLADGDFSASPDIEYCSEVSNPGPWCAFSVDENNIDVSVTDEVCTFFVNNPGSQNWEVQLIQAGFNLEAGHIYNLTFDVKADQQAPFGVFLGENGGNWINLVGDRYWQEATTEWQTISMEFKSPCVFESYKLSFELGFLNNTTILIDNVSLTDLGVYPAHINIIGTAVHGWEQYEPMLTDDGIHYYLNEFSLSAGQMKFMVNVWEFDWGGEEFPTGTGIPFGPNIDIPSPGNYTITFNHETAEYSFTCVSNCAPKIGVTGSAVPPFFNWDGNYPMSTPDGENYYIPFRYFGDGLVNFRQLDNWDMIWGSPNFPAGTAELDGEGIPVNEAFYTVHFNVNTLDYDFNYPFLGMVGSALDGWDNDIPMETEDGIHYVLPEHYFSQGATKFRANHDWARNWGTFWGEPFGGFPAGPAIPNQMDIFVPAGVYTVHLNLQTKEYSFEGTPCLNCPGDIHVASAPDWCGTIVDYPEPFVDEMCGTGFTVEQVEGLPPGSEFPLGETHQAYIAYNDQGEFMECHFNVIVEDVPPMIPFFEADYTMPWPPNHEMIPVTLNYDEITDNCGQAVESWLWIWHNEEELEKGEGNASPDWEIINPHLVMVRAERSGKGTGRDYHIVLRAVDEFGNMNQQEAIVRVEHDLGKSMNKSASVAEKFENNFDAEVWSNPTRSAFQLYLGSAPETDIEIILFNMNGQELSRETVINQTHSFGEDLSPGVYLLRLQSPEQSQTYKIVKE